MPADNPISKLKAAIKSRKVSVNIVPTKERTITITFRVTPDEKQRLEERCEGIVLSDYIRARLFDYPLPRRKAVMPQINREVRYELKRIATSINQHLVAIELAVSRGVQPLNKDVKAYQKELKEVALLVKDIRSQLDKCGLGVSNEDESEE